MSSSDLCCHAISFHKLPATTETLIILWGELVCSLMIMFVFFVIRHRVNSCFSLVIIFQFVFAKIVLQHGNMLITRQQILLLGLQSAEVLS